MLRVFWASDHDGWSNAKGYSVHNRMMREHTAARDDIELAESPDDADCIIDITIPTSFERLNDKPHFLFTMYEMAEPPQRWREGVNLADHIIVPCSHNVSVFEQITGLPISVCPEGVDPKIYQYVERTFPPPGKLFNFLYVGAPNPRKGYEVVCQAWDWAHRYYPDMVRNSRLILKTTKQDDPVGFVDDKFGAVIDTRRMSLEQLVHLYHIAHAFVIPSMGEGWGLTLCEACATGLPAVYTHWSGPEDFMVEAHAYPVYYRLDEHAALDKDGEVYHRGTVAKADPEETAELMYEIWRHYGEALGKAQKQSDRILESFTWDRAAARLAEILKENV
jgi:glycosyltransferase involved in cell wall biosynthesis